MKMSLLAFKKDDRLKPGQQKIFISDIRYTLSGVYVDLKKD